MPVVRCMPGDRAVEVPVGTLLTDAIRAAGLPIATACGDELICGRCGVRILEGEVAREKPAEMRAKRRNRLERQDAIGAAAVGDDLLRRVDIGEPRHELAQRDVQGARQMPERELVRRPDVEDGHCARARTPHELLARHRLQAVAIVEVAADQPLRLGDVPLRDPSHGRQEPEHRFVGERVEDVLALPARDHDPRPPQLLQVLGRVRDRKAGPLRQDLDAPLALGEVLHQLEPMCVRQRLRDGGELREQRQLRAAA